MAIIKLSSVQVNTEAGRRDYEFRFNGVDGAYLRETDLLVQLDGADVPFRLTSTNTLELLIVPEEGQELLIRRVMPKDRPYADFRRGNNFREQTVNNSFLQLLYTIQELLDGYFSGSIEFQDDVVFINNATAKGDFTVEGLLSLLNDLQVQGSVTANSGKVQVSGDEPDDILNQQAALDRFLQRGGDSTPGEYVFSGNAKVASVNGSDASSIPNIQYLEGVYSKLSGALYTGLVSFREGAEVSQVSDSGLAVPNRNFNDLRYISLSGSAPVGLHSYTNATVTVRDASTPLEPVNLKLLNAAEGALDAKIEATKQASDQKVQDIIDALESGDYATAGNAPVIWHRRTLSEVIIIPEDCEARTFGSELKIEDGAFVSVGDTSIWKFLND